jgi:1-phosphatidylinositol-3-phosphate 5-kinase
MPFYPSSVPCVDSPLPAAHLLPFYLREHSKRIMRGALWNDSKFLAQLNIMDYSLLVAVDSENNDLIVGIVGGFRVWVWSEEV